MQPQPIQQPPKSAQVTASVALILERAAQDLRPDGTLPEADAVITALCMACGPQEHAEGILRAAQEAIWPLESPPAWASRVLSDVREVLRERAEE